MSDLDEYTTRVLSRVSIAQDTLAFTLERPAGFQFEAGQYVSLRLLNFEAPSDGSDDGERALSIASAPQDPHLTIAVRVRDSAFKQQLANCSIDSAHPQLVFSPAMGDLVIPRDNKHPVVMLAGGIGITPFYGIIRDLAYRHSRGDVVPPITLLYGNRNQSSTAWNAQLEELTGCLPQLRVVHLLTEGCETTESHNGRCVSRQGMIDANVIAQEVPEHHNALYFVVGPAAMVAAMQDCLDECAIPPEQVYVEFFSGY